MFGDALNSLSKLLVIGLDTRRFHANFERCGINPLRIVSLLRILLEFLSRTYDLTGPEPPGNAKILRKLSKALAHGSSTSIFRSNRRWNVARNWAPRLQVDSCDLLRPGPIREQSKTVVQMIFPEDLNHDCR